MSSVRQLHPGPSTCGPVAHARLPHVLLVLDQFPENSGGAERIAFRQADLLPKLGYRVSILTLYAHPKSACLREAPCATYLLPLRSVFGLSAMRAAFSLRSFLAKHEVRIVQTFFESSDLWAGLVTKAASDAKLIWSRRDMGILRARKHEVAYKLLAGVPDAVIAVSDQVRRHAIEVDGIPPTRVRTIYNGLDLAAWEKRSGTPREASAPVVTTVGNLRHVKGHDVFLEAAAIVRRTLPATQFTIGGAILEPAYFAALVTQVDRLGLGQHVTFVGDVRNLQQHLSTADVFVLPSRSEGFSNAILEAMAAGLPVVATDVGGNAEAVQSGQTGWIVPPEDPVRLAEAMLDILGDPARARSMGDAGRKRVAEQFTTEAMMTGIARTYDTLLAQG